MVASKIQYPMNREEVLKSPDYWTAKTQIELYNQAEKFMKDTGRSRSQLADYLGVSKGYVTQLLNGDYDHRMSKFFELALAFGVVPQIEFIPVENYIADDICLSKFKRRVPVSKALSTEWKECNAPKKFSLECKVTMCPTVTGAPKYVA